jgi:hypothetical protein
VEKRNPGAKKKVTVIKKSRKRPARIRHRSDIDRHERSIVRKTETRRSSREKRDSRHKREFRRR